MLLSIIICTYNPDFEKLLLSVKSAICQKGIDFEVIITDDGSTQNYRREIENYLKDIHFVNYTYIEHKNNIGIVKNVLYAVKQAKGEYIFLNSPGDYIYDENALAGFCSFAKKNNAEICFGDYIAYQKDNNNRISFVDFVRPLGPSVYDRQFEDYYSAFFFGEDILGASYLRKKSFFLESLEFVSQYSKYVEDGTTTAYGLLKGIPIYHYSKNVVWYEYGDGISTSGKTKWVEIIRNDFLSTYKALLLKYPNRRVLMARIYSLENPYKNVWVKRLTSIIRFPFLSFRVMLLRFIPRKVFSAESVSVDALKKILDITRDVELCK